MSKIVNISSAPMRGEALWMRDNRTTKTYIATKVANGEANQLIGVQKTEPPRIVAIITDETIEAGDQLAIFVSPEIGFQSKFQVEAVRSYKANGNYSYGSTYWECEVSMLVPDPAPKVKAKPEPAVA